MKLVEARHPLLDPALLELREAALGQPGHAGEITPLTVEFIPGECALVVTGPNAGGKTVALKTVGLLVLAAHCGLPVPAAAGTAVPFLQTLVATVGDEQDLLADRSTFSGRLLRLKEAWEGAGPDSLVLLDELGSGTDPEEGAALSVTLLEGLVEKQALTVVTTHLVELAAAALELPGASCASMELDGETAEPTFRLVPGPPGGSEALGLARRLGLPAAWLDRAEERLGLEHRDLRRLLSEVEKIRQELAETKLRVETEESDAAKLRERLERELSALVDERLRLAKNLRAELETFRLETGRKLRGEVERLRDEVAAGRRKGLAEKAAARLFAAAPEIEVPETAEDGGPPVAGDAVRHRTFGWEGRLEKLDGDRAEVSVRGKRVRCRAGELSRVAPRAGTGAGSGRVRSPRSSVAVEPEAAGVSSELNLIGRRVEPALQALDGYLDQALLSSREEVRIIHGHGTGRLRKAVRDHLRRHPAVAAQRPGKSSEGGDGATVARLK